MAEKFMEKERKALEKFLRREMPVIAGRMAQDHFQNNFRLGGFVNGGMHPWPGQAVVIGWNRSCQQLRHATFRSQSSIQINQIHTV